MNQRTREQLLDYILGALDAEEHAEIEQRVAADPALQEEVERVAEQLFPLVGVDDDIDPPPHLAARTCDFVAAQTDFELPAAMSGCSNQTPVDGDRAFTDATFPPVTYGQGKLGEFIVATGIFMAVALLFFPAISSSRQTARLAQCHNNLRQLGIAMAYYCDLSGGFFPGVPADGRRAFAGIYGPILHDQGQLVDDELLICPSSALARSKERFEIPTLAEIDAANAGELVSIRRLAGGSYGYNIGVVQDGVYRPAKNSGRSYFAVMADTPTISLTGYSSLNHGGHGVSLLYEDGRIRYVVRADEDEYLDHPFRNHRGVVEPGVTEDDAVIAPSYAPPFAHLVYGLQRP